MLFHWTSAGTRPGKVEGKGMYRVMTVALDAATLSNVQAALAKLECTFSSAGDATRALQELCTQDHALVIASYPLPHLLLRHFLQQLRHPTCASRQTPLLVLAIPELLSGASRFIGYGANAVLPRWVARTKLASTVERLLESPRRYTPSPDLEVRLQNPDGSPIPAAGVVNISGNGLLLQSPVRPMLGATVRAVLIHPQLAQPLELPARVVRYTLPGREQFEGFAVTFAGQPLEAALPVLT